MSQVNVNPPGPGGPYYNDGGAAGVNVLAIVLAIVLVIVIAIVAWGATAGHWFGGSTTNPGNTTISVSAPARAPGGNTSPVTTSPAPSR